MGKFEEAVVAPRRAFVMVPGLQVIERPGWLQLMNPSFRVGGQNEVAHSVLTAAEADGVIASTLAMYRARGVRFRWYVQPDSAPADLASRLVAHGMREVEGIAVIRDTSPLACEAIAIEQVTAETVEEFTRTKAAAWELDPAPLAELHRRTIASANQRCYLARIAGEPVATAGLVLFPQSAYLIGGVVMPAARKRGVYRALVARRIDDARAAGIPHVTSRAIAATSGPLLLRMGFELVANVCTYHDRVNEPLETMRTRFEDAYRRLEHEARDAFDLACAERALAIHDDAIAKRLLRLAREGASPDDMNPVRDAVYATIVRRRDADDHPTQVAVAVARSVMGATMGIQHGLANSDYTPTSADETRTAVYLSTYVRTQDLEAAEAARAAELRWQLEQVL